MKLNEIEQRLHTLWQEKRSPRIGAPPTDIEKPIDAAETCVTTRIFDEASCVVHDGIVPHEQGKTRWIEITGLSDSDGIARILRSLGLSDLSIAEVFQTDQRPKSLITDTDVLTFLRIPTKRLPFRSQQLALFLGDGFVLTLRETADGCFDPIHARLSAGKGRIRSGAGYLTYALVDAVLDLWFPLIEAYGDRMEELELIILEQSTEDAVKELHLLKRDMLGIRRAIWPLRDALSGFLKDGTPHVEVWMHPYFRDCVDHAFQALDMVEVYREVAQGLIDLHLSTLSNKMNEVMKLLAIISTIFIPMTFITGLYGMNFDRASPWNLPELGWRFGYEYALGLMLGSAGIMVFVFYRLGWLTRRRPPPDDLP
ncbi:magnesium/cobalt transporter CorA [Mesobacterium sp. TK19101]|uniref:Magnesium transport protein CorA n=1 Tax=Mesobacterium hydrothermale TaxID=3111907 RepID=A0ABU6HL59_9RHOB|nr:magnesium/cobalt transporter CorA [Mesobacterium sp. TK19101]MEC3863096.1 magnesium/cobalt transporter CorA [Mesobacterium sp. TK19101]